MAATLSLATSLETRTFRAPPVPGTSTPASGLVARVYDDGFTFNVRHARGFCIGQVVRCFDHRVRGFLPLRRDNNIYGAVEAQGLTEFGLNPVASDLPMIEAILARVPSPAHHYGAKDVCPPMAATANAIERASLEGRSGVAIRNAHRRRSSRIPLIPSLPMGCSLINISNARVLRVQAADRTGRNRITRGAAIASPIKDAIGVAEELAGYTPCSQGNRAQLRHAMKQQSELGLTSTSTTITPHSSHNDVAGDAEFVQLSPVTAGGAFAMARPHVTLGIKGRVGASCRQCLVRRAVRGRSTYSQTRLLGRRVRYPLLSIENCTALVRTLLVSAIDA